MTSSFKMYVDAHKAEQKLRLLRKQVRDGAELSVSEIGELAKAYARSHAPVGKTGRLISLIKLEKKDKFNAILRSMNPTLSDGHKRGRYGGPVPFNLVTWMHLTRGKWRTGPLKGIQANFGNKDPRYMYRTTEYIRRVAGVKANTAFNKVIIKS